MAKQELFKPRDEMRACSYSRQSELENEGMDRQDQLNRDAAARRDIPVVRSFFDNDVSASKPRGPKTDWGQMIAGIKSGEFNTIISVNMDRLLRSPRDLLTLMDLGARVLTVDGEIDLTTAEGELHGMFMASIAKFEVRRKAERQQRSNEWWAKQGKPRGIWQPFGYADDHITIIPEQAGAIRNAAEMYLGGVTLAAIARSWNDAGFLSNRNMPFSPLTVKGILKNPRYVGLRSYNGEIVATAVWEPILEQETWDAVQAKMAGRKLAVARPISTPRHLLVGILFCEVCGKKMGIGYRGKGNRLYRCPGAHITRRADVLEEYLSALVIDRLSRPDAHELLATSDVLELGKLRDEGQQLRERQSYLGAMFGAGTLPAEALAAGMDQINARLADVDDLLKRAAHTDVLAPLLGAADAVEAWQALPTERKRVIFERLMRVEVRALPRGYRGKLKPEDFNISWLD